MPETPVVAPFVAETAFVAEMPLLPEPRETVYAAPAIATARATAAASLSQRDGTIYFASCFSLTRRICVMTACAA